MAQEKMSKPQRPRAKPIIIILTAVMTFRVFAIMFLPEAASGPGSPLVSWFIPILGDAIIGITAPIVAVVLWKWNTLGAWTLAVVWQTLAIWDSATAAALEVIAGGGPFEGAGVGPFIAVTLVGLVNLYLLSLPSVRHYYIK